MLSGRDYYAELIKYITTYERRQIDNIAKRADHRDMEKWWLRRHHHTPGGSTSAGAWARKLFQEDGRMGTNDRPSKKSVVEALPDDLWKILLCFRPMLVARASTKYEPGDKRRALYAVNDIPYIISSWASFNAEKEADMPGISARQTPEDFLGWLSDCEDLRGYWLSSDYDDYNKEHTLEELALCNLIRARVWLDVDKTYVGKQKAAAHYWLAEAVLSSSVQWAREESTRVFSGLFSGSRDTMRDHCTLHNADVRIIIDEAARCGYPCRRVHPTRGEHEAGDDEDLCFDNELSASVYAKTALALGHELNPRKQMAGRRHHEYLQVQAVPKGNAQRPLAAILATLGTGNWYVPSATWFDANIQGVSDNWWEASVRGLPLASAQHMACAYLDTMMRLHDDVRGGWVKLEWWDYRSPGYAHPLWGVVTAKPPVTRKYPEPHKSWPSLASDAWIRVHGRLLRGIPARKVEEYRQALLESSHGSAFTQYRQVQLRAEVRHNWPVREDRRYELDRTFASPGFTMSEMVQYYRVLGGGSKPRSEGEQASRMGLDPQIVALIGAHGSLARLLDGPSWSKYEGVVQPRAITERAWASSWAFRSWCLRTSGFHPDLHKSDSGAVPKLACYVYAPNGAGKTWLLARNCEWADIDDLSRPIGLNKPVYIEGRENASARRLYLALVIRRAIASSCRVLLGQWDPDEVVEVASPMGLRLRVIGYDPGLEVRIHRLKARGWDDDKISRRARRWVVLPESCATPEELALAVSKELNRHGGEL